MALELVTISGIPGVVQPVRGPRTGDELLAENRALFFDRTDRFRACRFWYADFTGSDLTGVTPEHIRQLGEIAERAAKTNPDLVVAIVAPEDLQFGLGRMWTLFTDVTDWTLGTFRTRHEAAVWLSECLGEPIVF